MRKNEKQGRDVVLKFSDHKRKRVDELETDLDALFQLPLTEFTGERNALAARLKKGGRGDEASLVKALAKPPVSAWAVNQLYWNHRETFDALLASGERFHKSQTSAKVADMRAALDTRREALTELTDLASSLLQDAGHNPSLDIIRRITSTLEAISVYASRADAPRPGRLTQDVDPPGFESLASWTPAAGMMQQAGKGKEAGGRRPAAGAGGARTNTRQKPASDDEARQIEAARKAQVAEAKVSLQEAKRALAQARTRVERLEAAQKKADAEAKKAEKQRRDAEQSLEKAKAASDDASRRARKVAGEVEEAESAADDAERAVEEASKELQALSG